MPTENFEGTKEGFPLMVGWGSGGRGELRIDWINPHAGWNTNRTFFGITEPIYARLRPLLLMEFDAPPIRRGNYQPRNNRPAPCSRALAKTHPFSIMGNQRKRMKKIAVILLLMIVLSGCDKSAEDTSSGRTRTIIIEGCEYIEYDDGLFDTRVYSLTHKGNCKNPIHTCSKQP